jgi:anti-sigma-K factor RskA
LSATAGHHDDVAGYALGRLEPAERARFEAHLETCEACRAELDELREVAGLLPLASPAAAPPPNLEARVLAAVRREATPAPHPQAAPAARPSRRLPGWAPRLGVAALAAAAIAGAFLLGGRVLDDGVDGTREITATLVDPGGGGAASVEVTKTGIGRVVELSSDDLPILPTGELYEVWFVGPDDRPGARHRISAGTFHPDEGGRSRVTLAAAVDPAKFPTIVVTAEPGDGDPAPGREVLRWTAP